jgi:hypothetical protein
MRAHTRLPAHLGQSTREPVPIAATSGLRRRTTSASIDAMSDPRTAPYASAHLSDIIEDIRDSEDTGDGTWHLVRRHFDVQAFGVNASRGDAGDVLIIEHHERDDAENGTEGHEELFAIISGHAVFTIDGKDLDAPAGTLVFVRDPALLRTARAIADGTAILAVGARPGAPFAVSRWEQAID